MKKATITALLSLFTALCSVTAWGSDGEVLVAEARRGAKQRTEHSASAPKMEFLSAEHDFEQVSESGERVSYDYVVTNTGSCPLIITRALYHVDV